MTGSDVCSSDLLGVEEQASELPEGGILVAEELTLSDLAAIEPQRLTSYLLDTARKVHLWYHKSHVLNEPEPIMRARLALARASQIVIRNGLHALGITAPERM